MVRLTAIDQQNVTWILDLDEVPGIELTYSVKELKDISKRTSTWSKTIQLPGSKTNNLFFEQQFNVNVASNRFNPNHRVLINLSEGGVEQLNGYLQLTNIMISDSGEVNYNVTLFGTLVDFSKSLGEKLLTGNVTLSDNLDFSDVISTIVDTPQYAISTWDGNADSFGVVYPLIEFSGRFGPNELTNKNSTPDQIILNQNLLPSLYVKRIWDKIFYQAGFRYTSDFINSQDFKKLYIVNPNLDRDDEKELILTAWKRNGADDQSISSTASVVNRTLTYQGENDPNNYWNTTTSTFTSPSAGYYTFTVNTNLQFNSPGGNPVVSYFSLFKNGRDSIAFPTSFVASGQGAIQRFFAQNTIYLIANDTVQIKLDFPANMAGTITTVTNNTGSNYISIQSSSRRATSASLLPEKIKQIDFITSIVKMFNLIIESDPSDPTNLIITPRNEWLNQGVVRDWSEKLDRKSGYSLTLLSDESSKLYNFSHVKDSDYLNKLYFDEKGFVVGTAEIEVDNDFLKDKTEIKTSFGPSIGDFCVSSSVYLNRIYDFDGQTYKKVATAPKILVFNGKKPALFSTLYPNRISISGVTTTFYPLSTMYFNPDDNDSQSIHFGNSVNNYLSSGVMNTNGLYDTYWSDEIDSISSPDAKYLKCKMWLQPKDIENLKFNDKIYLQVEGNPSYWRLQKVVYRPGSEELSDVELIKIDSLETKPVVQKRRSFKDWFPTDVDTYDPAFPGVGKLPTIRGELFNQPGYNPTGDSNINQGFYNSIVGYSNFVDSGIYFSGITGDLNIISGSSSYINVIGSSNSVVDSTNITVNGSNNIVATSSNVTVIGNDNFVPSSANNVVVAGNNVIVPPNSTGLPVFEVQAGVSPDDDSMAIGHGVLPNNDPVLGRQNIGFGFESLNANTTGAGNIGIGYLTLTENTIGNNNLAVGSLALSSNTTGLDNIAVGASSLLSNVDGTTNIAIGNSSLTSNISGDFNIAVGNAAMGLNDTNNNLSIGHNSLATNISGSYSIAIGNNSMGDATNTGSGIGGTAFGVIAIGVDSLRNNDAGSNIALGHKSLESNTTGFSNTAVGNSSLTSNTTGFSNTAVGDRSIPNNIDGDGNVAVGNGTLEYLQSGNGNVAIGTTSLNSATTGSNNVAIGSSSNQTTTTGQNVITIGSNANPATNTTNNAIALGRGAVAGDNQCVFGTTTDIIIPVLPNLTTAQRATVTAVPGMSIFNTTTGTAEYFNGTVWISY